MAGGGYRGTFAGTVTITAHDLNDGSPIGGALVRIDGIDVGATAEDGSIVIDGEAPDRIEVSAEGYQTTAYVGTSAEVVTVAMRPAPTLRRVSGTVTGLDALEVPEGAILRTRVGVATEGGRVTLPDPMLPSICDGTDPCAFAMRVAPDVVSRFFAQIEAIDDQGTTETDDDVVTPLSFALSDVVIPSGADEIADVVVAPLPASALSAVELDLPGPVPGSDRVVGVPGVGLGSAIFFFGAHEGQTRFLLPAATGEFEGSRRWAVTRATREDGAESVAVVRAATGEAVEALVAPTPEAIPELSQSGGVVDLSAQGPHAVVEVWDSSEDRSTLVFDDRDSLSVGASARVTMWNAPAQTDGFRLSELRSTFTGWVSVPVDAL